MFLSSDTGIIIVGIIMVIGLIFIVSDNIIRAKKRKQRLEEYQRKLQQEKEEQEQKNKLEQEAKQKKINDFNAQYSEESIQEHILEFEDELKARTQIIIKCSEKFKLNSNTNTPQIRFHRNPIPKASTYEKLREEYLNKSKYNRFTFDKSISFYQCLVKYLDEKGITEPELYNAAGIQRQTFYKIKSIEGYVPRRRTVFYFILYLKLTIEEANELLSLAGYQLNPSSKIESFIKHCIENELYDIDEINDFLYDHFNEVL